MALTSCYTVSKFPAFLQFFLWYIIYILIQYIIIMYMQMYCLTYVLPWLATAYHLPHLFCAPPNESLCHQTSCNKAPDKEEGGKSAPAEKVVAGAWIDAVVCWAWCLVPNRFNQWLQCVDARGLGCVFFFEVGVLMLIHLWFSSVTQIFLKGLQQRHC